MNILITGGAGFIGSNFCHLLRSEGFPDRKKVNNLIVLDALTYAGNKMNLAGVADLQIIEGNILNTELVSKILVENKISHVFHFAAESHVDNSILGPQPFIQTNIVGTFSVLEAIRGYSAKKQFERLTHISTDEVFGELGPTGLFKETTPYSPNSPYSASKAASDHLVSAWFHTYKIPTVITNCSNNYGPRQFPEKLIPVVIKKALSGEPIPVYGKGENIRDWIFVDDHNQGVWLAATQGKIGESYCFGARQEVKNLNLVHMICEILDELKPKSNKYSEQIQFVADRPGHDFRYAIDPTKAETELGFRCDVESVKNGLLKTLPWYLL
ncbi:MAG: dTDP-glucose 4,6-dehydratase [Pseudobdellovibrionaceae bacterium]